jgi:hypothetical protein
MAHREAEHDVIECPSEVVESVTQQDGPGPQVGLGVKVHGEYVLAAVGVAVTSNAAWLKIAPTLDLSVEGFEMEVRTGDLGAAARFEKGASAHLPPLPWEQ